MDREKFDASVALLDELVVALAGSEHVSSYDRTSKTGKVVHVGAYTRDPGTMPNGDLFKEYKDLSAGKSGLPETAQRNRLAQIVHEIATRKERGEWGHTRMVTDPKDAAPAADAPTETVKRKTPAKPEKPESPTPDAAETPDATKPDAGAKADENPEDGWKPGADHALTAFLDEQHKRQTEGQGMYVPNRDEEKEWAERLEQSVAQPLREDQIADLLLGPTTAEKHLEKNPDGSMSFSAERQALHKKIVSAFLDGFAPQEKPRYHMMGGGPASGKSVMERANPEISEGHALVNADEIKAMLPEAWNEDGSLNSAFAHEESSHIAKLVQQEAFARKLGVTLDGTGDGGAQGVRKKLAQAREHGYEVHGYYVSTDVETAVKRAAQRAAKPPYRAVPEPLLRKTHSDVSQTFPQVMDEFDSVKLYDSTTREGSLVGLKKPGSQFAILDADAWKAFLDKGHAADRPS